MTKCRYYYKRGQQKKAKGIIRIASLGVFLAGSIMLVYVFFPLILWELYFKPVFASKTIQAPVPQITLLNSSVIKSIILQAKNSLEFVDYTNAQNWFPNYHPEVLGKNRNLKTSGYRLSIPKLNIASAFVSTRNTDLASNLVNYPGTPMPAEFGNAVIFGHSTLPQLFNPKDYKTIFANLYKLTIGDKIYAYVDGVTYTYEIYGISVVEPSDTSAFAQDYNNSYLTLVTCTPPGTVWKRLIVKTKIKTI